MITDPETQLMVSFLVALGGSQSDHHHGKPLDLSLSKSLTTMLVIWEADLVKQLKPCSRRGIDSIQMERHISKGLKMQIPLDWKKRFHPWLQGDPERIAG